MLVEGGCHSSRETPPTLFHTDLSVCPPLPAALSPVQSEERTGDAVWDTFIDLFCRSMSRENGFGCCVVMSCNKGFEAVILGAMMESLTRKTS